MEGARRIYEIPLQERRQGDGRFIRLPKPTDGPFYPLDSLTIPRLRKTRNAYYSAPYESDDELREIDIIHLSSTIGATVWFVTDCVLHTEMKTWSLVSQVLFTFLVLTTYSIINRYFYHYFSDFLDFQWHEERPLWGKGGMEHFGFVAFWRLAIALGRLPGAIRWLSNFEEDPRCPVADCEICKWRDWDDHLADGYQLIATTDEYSSESEGETFLHDLK